MSVLNRYKELQMQLEAAKEKHEALNSDPEVQRLLEATSLFREAMSEYGLTSLQALVDLLEPGYAVVPGESLAGKPSATGKSRRKRPLMVYTNPHTGAVVEARSISNRTLREWREQWGDTEVLGWGVEKS